MGRAARAFSLAGVLAFAGCAGAQSALDPAGHSAAQLADLFWWMTGGAVLIWLAVVALTLYAVYFARTPFSPAAAHRLIIGGGVVFPILVLTGLLSYGLATMPSLLAPTAAGTLKIHVAGEQWWWRVRYLPPGKQPIDLANEIRLPVGRTVEFQLESRDVIHSFWIPSLAGKTDMIPGRQTRLRVEATRTGLFRGVCAEYCGSSHAFMSFPVVVQEPAEFARWLEQQSEPAAQPATTLASQGRELFLANGCGACHTVRGTDADGVVGPDLTHVGGRLSLGAGRLGNNVDAFRRWLAHTSKLKPNVLMPAFDMLAPEQLLALGVYLEQLE